MNQPGKKLVFIAMAVIAIAIAYVFVPGLGFFNNEASDPGGSSTITSASLSAAAGSATGDTIETDHTPIVTRAGSSNNVAGRVTGSSDGGATSSSGDSGSVTYVAETYIESAEAGSAKVGSENGDVSFTPKSKKDDVKSTPIIPHKRTPEPTGTIAPAPTGTITPAPTETIAPEPTETIAPAPTGTITPEPTGTIAPEPTGTITPVAECYGAEACNPTGDPIGGGAGYSRTITQADPSVKYVVSTKEELLSALTNAKSGEVVFVKGTAVIDMNGAANTIIPPGVILASDRGFGGSEGALIIKKQNVTNNWGESLFVAKDGVRITGLRLEGEMKPKFDVSVPERNYLTGIRTLYAIEVDNCEIRGWSWAGVLSGTGGSANYAYVHHNYIHSNQAPGEGYGVEVYGGNALIEANIFDYNRHSIAGTGVTGESYEARYNLDLGHTYQYEHRFDIHANPAGGTYSGYSYRIHHNTFENEIGTGYDIKYRGSEPELGVWIDHNIFTWYESWVSCPVFSYASISGKSKTYVANNMVGIPPKTLKSDWNGVIQFPAE